jgi:hypothetical protein
MAKRTRRQFLQETALEAQPRSWPIVFCRFRQTRRQLLRHSLAEALR